jgi:four helix bundle protein
MEKLKDIGERTFQYSLRAIKLYQFLQKQKDRTGWIIGEQYLRSAISIGANIEEAQAGESRRDFIHKYGISQKEAKESLYWLKPLAEANIVPETKLDPLITETEEIYAVITRIIINSKRRTK